MASCTRARAELFPDGSALCASLSGPRVVSVSQFGSVCGHHHHHHHHWTWTGPQSQETLAAASLGQPVAMGTKQNSIYNQTFL